MIFLPVPSHRRRLKNTEDDGTKSHLQGLVRVTRREGGESESQPSTWNCGLPVVGELIVSTDAFPGHSQLVSWFSSDAVRTEINKQNGYVVTSYA